METALENQGSVMQYGNDVNIPFVAVWMVTYNHETYISQAIESVMMQKTTFSYKLFIGEDFSTDKTREICIAYQQEHSDKIVLLLNKNNIGAVLNAKNTFDACFNCGAKYIALLEGDDYWVDNQKLQRQVSFLESNSQYSMCFHDVFHLNERDLLKNDNEVVYGPSNANKNIIGREYTFKSVFRKNEISSCSVVFRAKYFDPNFFRINNIIGDLQIYFQLLQNKPGYFLPSRMAVYRIHSNGVFSGANNIDRVFHMNDLFRCFLVKSPIKYRKIFKQGITKCSYFIACEFLKQGKIRDSFKYFHKTIFEFPFVNWLDKLKLIVRFSSLSVEIIFQGFKSK